MKITPLTTSFKSAFKSSQVFKNQILTSNTIKALSLSAGALATIAGIKKTQDISKLKKVLLQVYDELYKDMAQESKKFGLDFVKPVLEFKKMEKTLSGGYNFGLNKITINSDSLLFNPTARYSDGAYIMDKLNDGKLIPQDDFVVSFKQRFSKDFTVIKGDEKLLNLCASLRHELTHARQEQIKLSIPNSIECIYEMHKKTNPQDMKGIELQDYKRILHFYGDYKPAREIMPDEKITYTLEHVLNAQGNPVEISYYAQDLIDCIKGYDLKNPNQYFTNVMEIEAYAQQADFIANYKKYLPNIQIDNDVYEYYLTCFECICQTLLS